MAPLLPLLSEARNVYARPDQVQAWVERAGEGDEFVYATRCTRLLAPNCAVGVAVRDLAQRKLVHPFQRRIEGLEEKNYIVRRTAAPFRSASLAPRAERQPRHRDDEAAAINALLPVLERAARFSRPCPTDAQLAERAGIKREDVKPVLDAMAAIGLIRVLPAPAPTLRQVVIVDKGYRTGVVA